MFERFSKELKATAKSAQDVAKAEGAPAIEAPHLLLAMVRAAGPTAPALERLGLSEDVVRAALERELATALQAVGVVAPDGLRPRAGVGRSNPPWGQSAKLALERTLRAGVEEGERQLEGRHLLLALARAEAGVVPRLLAELDITPAKIRSALA